MVRTKKIWVSVLAIVLACCLLMLSVFSFASVAVAADEQADPVESDTFHGYEVLGYDEEGNAELSNEDYEEYFNKMLAEREQKLLNGEVLEAVEQPKKKQALA